MQPVLLSHPHERERPRSRGVLARWRGDVRGTTALEFAMVGAPFVLLLLGIMTAGLQFFTIQSLERGVMDAARKIRTGEAQKQNKTLGDFRQMVCDAAGSYIACTNKLVVHVKSGKAFSELDPPVSCLTSGNLTPSAGSASDPLVNHSGTQGAAVLVTACYEWELGGLLWQKAWNLMTVGPGGQQTANNTGATIIQATATFRTEPYQ